MRSHAPDAARPALRADDATFETRPEGITTAQLPPAWLLAQGEDVAPIPGTRSTKRLEENAGAVDVQLSATDLARITEILPHGSAGSRYPAAILSIFTRVYEAGPVGRRRHRGARGCGPRRAGDLRERQHHVL
ncbi:aldo/keto reductase [Streptomyces sp. ID05-47C]|uniref:aldo/keto reductase n=1 Tax=Streptomyces sp. ID05-47C TaxID=3028665 RepID=UPI0029BC60F2|nr:aldo/keto reductase [Streptomyces sp. ID05-47C]MDX3573807.1 aldo/keto reductase [Streptomyces sp. ID05-47C]